MNESPKLLEVMRFVRFSGRKEECELVPVRIHNPACRNNQFPAKKIQSGCTSGGSGGPLFNNEGKVIGINFAMVREFGGSNFAIPVAYGQSLLKP